MTNPPTAAPGVAVEEAIADLMDIAGRISYPGDEGPMAYKELESALRTALLAGAAGGQTSTSQVLTAQSLKKRLSDKNHLVYVADPLSSTACRGVFVNDVLPWWWDAGIVYERQDDAFEVGLLMRANSRAHPPVPVRAPQEVTQEEVRVALAIFNNDNNETGTKAMRRALEAFAASRLGTGALPASNRDALIDLIQQHLICMYHCTRVWEAWNVGTMTQDDFIYAPESDTAAELADAILAATPPSAAPAEPQNESKLYIVMNERGSQGVIFNDKTNAKWTQTGRGGHFGVPSIGENFRECYGDGKLTLHEVSAEILSATLPGEVQVDAARLKAVDDEDEDKYVARGRAVMAWQAMLAAAPQPPAGQQPVYSKSEVKRLATHIGWEPKGGQQDRGEALRWAAEQIETIDDGESPAYRHCQEFLRGLAATAGEATAAQGADWLLIETATERDGLVLVYTPRTALYAAPVRGLPLTEVDWVAVGRILETHHALRDTYITGTSNWGAAIWKAAHGIGTTAPGGDGEDS